MATQVGHAAASGGYGTPSAFAIGFDLASLGWLLCAAIAVAITSIAARMDRARKASAGAGAPAPSSGLAEAVGTNGAARGLGLAA